jgi:heme exporter protein CcmD
MELLSMGGYGSFVWSSYFLTLVVVIVSGIQARRRHRQVTDEIRQKLRVEEN